MISVLMPVYNAATTLGPALASVLRQTCPEWELVAVDDGSTDGSADLLAACADPRVRLLRRPHEGLVAALNAGLAACRGEWLARFDADDLMCRDRLRRQLAAGFEGVLGCAVRTFPRASLSEGFARYEAWLNSLLTPAQIDADIFVESPLAHPTAFLPTALLRDVGGYRDLGWAEDYDLWLRLWSRGVRFRKLPEVLHLWRDHPGRLTRGGGVYGRAAFRRCKVAHLPGWLGERRAVSVWGAGKGGRFWSRALTAAGLTVVRHVDPSPEWIGRTIRGAPVVAPEVLRTVRDTPLLVTVGVHGARAAIRAFLADCGWREGVDFRCVA